VDDNQQMRKMLRQLLSFDFEVVGVAATGDEAIGAVIEAQPDVVVIDYMMPGLDGIATARAIREQRPEQAIILYTAFLDAEIEARAADAGIALCVGKVEGLSTLERDIRRLTGQLF
jgi:DNA-binding NarL/FixJ family response regulator